MPSRVWSYICHDFIRADNGEWLPIEEVSRLSFRSLPAIIERLHVISYWSGEENEDFSVKTMMRSPLGAIVREAPADHCIIKRNRDSGLSQRMVDALFLQIPIREFGKYRVEFIVDDVLFHMMLLTIARGEM